MSRSVTVWDNAAPGSFFPSLESERIAQKVYRRRGHDKADASDCIERFCNPTHRLSTRAYRSPMDFERQVLLA